ncbi:aminotransferase class III-fold pyridoxal phosphate-dependent enzyme [Leucobacter aridicollis]|uniref:aminotransferase class III-fold pyridoxal phosphate-dependent enzyme n=1 Tax=Leucobacter aridicollis TaxID=283878 RepID=UPI002105099A|nr:aminotransferase class III-fold pyridoxal phosphate-dependent enzyme [Leucobacter aridicollis]UTX51953.1 aminotransferase class III-fold pyridoxal phosphate-dependent enzyme [Leucobacter aridicollis]
MSNSYPNRVTTAVPGPRSQSAHAARQQHVSASVGSYMPIYIERADGSILTDLDGNEFIDFGCGIGVTSLGHANEAAVGAMREQLEAFTHTLFTVTPYELYTEVARLLGEITPGDFAKKSVLSTTGAEAIENAVKIARSFTRRNGIAVVEHGYHGRTNLTLGMNYKAQPYSTGVGPRAGEIYRVPNSYPFRDGEQDGSVIARKAIKTLEKISGADNLACLVIEPIQGEGGIVVPAPGYLETLQAWCAENGIVVIADEIQTGLGRTGKLFASEHFGFVPDLVVTAKAIGAGIPLSAVTGRADVMDAIPAGGLSGTYSGNPVACAAAIEVLSQLTAPGAMDRTTEIGERLRAGLAQLQEKYPVIGDVRGHGALFGIELVDADGEPNVPAFATVSQAALANGLLVMAGGSDGHVLRLLPQVNISDELIDEALSILDTAFSAL